MVIETCPKFYAVPSPPQNMTVRSRSQTWVFMLNFYNVSFCKAFDGFVSCCKNRHKILNVSERRSAISASCPVRRRRAFIITVIVRICIGKPSHFGKVFLCNFFQKFISATIHQKAFIFGDHRYPGWSAFIPWLLNPRAHVPGLRLEVKI